MHAWLPGGDSVFQNRLADLTSTTIGPWFFGFCGFGLSEVRWDSVLNSSVTAIPCLAGLLVTVIAKFEFTRHYRALQWAADALESELWRYRTRTGRYRVRSTSWTALMDQIESESDGNPFGVARQQQRILKDYVQKQEDITQDEEIQKFHAMGTCVGCAHPLSGLGLVLAKYLYGCGRAYRLDEPNANQIADTRTRLFPFSSKKDYESYKERQHCYLWSVWSGEKPFFGFLWELYFEFLLFNGQDRILCPMVKEADQMQTRDVESSDDACRGYCSSLLWRLILVFVFTVILAACIPLVPVYVILLGMYSCLKLTCSTAAVQLQGMWSTLKNDLSCHRSGSEALRGHEQTIGHSRLRETQITADQYYEVRFCAVYDEVKAQKRRRDHQHAVLLITQAVLNVAALIVSQPADVGLVESPKVLSTDPAQSVLVTETMLVGPSEPAALCLPSAEVGRSVISATWLETQLDDECTQVMRYASCEDERCVSDDSHILSRSTIVGLDPYGTFCCAFDVQRSGTDSLMYAFNVNGRRLSSLGQPAARLRQDCHVAARVRRTNHTRPGISLRRPRSPLKT